MENPTDEIKELGERIKTRFSTETYPSFFLKIPREVAKDAMLNLSRVLDSETTILPRADRLLIAVGLALYKNPVHDFTLWLKSAAETAQKKTSEIEAAHAVALTCAIHNGYYKFKSTLTLEKSSLFSSFQAGLRATPYVQSILSKTMVELISIPVSLYEGCSSCLNGHVQSALQHGSTPAMIDECVKIGAVIFPLLYL